MNNWNKDALRLQALIDKCKQHRHNKNGTPKWSQQPQLND